MKQFSAIIYGLVVLAGVALAACNKEKYTYGTTNIFMPQAVNISGGLTAEYPVPSGTDSSTYNYTLDTENQKVNVILGVSRAGMQANEAFTVDVATNSDTIGQLLATGVLDASTMLMPSSLYTLPTSVSVVAGKSENTFSLVLDIAQLKLSEYAGKTLALAVKITNPSKYTVDSSLATTIVLVDVDQLVIGPAVNVTSSYLKNTSTPFTVAALSSGGRWGTLTDWTANDAAKSHNGYGGYASDDGGTIDLESGWGSPAIYNGKLYQTATLPAGTYMFDVSDLDWEGTLDPAYIVVAPNVDELPDYSTIDGNASIYYTLFSSPKITFTLTEPTKVTVGFVVNYVQDEQGFKIYSVKLYNYPQHL